MLRCNKEGPLFVKLKGVIYLIYKVKYYDLEQAKFIIIVITDKQELINKIQELLDNDRVSLKSITKI